MRSKPARPAAKKAGGPAKRGGKKKMPPELLERFKKKADKGSMKEKPGMKKRTDMKEKPSMKKKTDMKKPGMGAPKGRRMMRKKR